MHRFMIEVEYAVGDTVYLKCDEDGDPGIVTGYCVGGKLHEDSTLYSVAWGNRNETKHYSIELSSEPCPRYPVPEKHDA